MLVSMMELRKGAIAAIALTSMGLGAAGAWMFAPAASSAQPTTTTVPNGNGSAPNASGGPSGSFHSNEDPTHEKSESPQREAEENSGQFSGHCHHGSGSGGQSGSSGQSGQPGSGSASQSDLHLP
jgi:hypothetical protein